MAMFEMLIRIFSLTRKELLVVLKDQEREVRKGAARALGRKSVRAAN